MQRLVDGSKEDRSAADQGPLHMHFNVRGMLNIEDPTVTVKCRICF
jgi:hypothetical protein